VLAMVGGIGASRLLAVGAAQRAPSAAPTARGSAARAGYGHDGAARVGAAALGGLPADLYPGECQRRAWLCIDSGRDKACTVLSAWAPACWAAAATFHLQRLVDNYAARLFSLCTPVSATVYGNPSEEVRAALAGFSPQYLSTLGGYTRR
jgi:hypothetical protein